MTKSDSLPICPEARTLRVVLREAGLEGFVQKVTSGRRCTYVRLTSQAPEGAAERIAAAFRPLWMDGAARVCVVYAGLVVVGREYWYRVYPDTPEGRAAYAEKEQQHTDQLLQAIERGKTLYVASGEPDEYREPVYQPTEHDPFRPWLVPSTRSRYPSGRIYVSADWPLVSGSL